MVLTGIELGGCQWHHPEGYTDSLCGPTRIQAIQLTGDYMVSYSVLLPNEELFVTA